MEFSDSIKQLRKDNKLTQEQLASKLHVTRQAISNWENN
ncbi:MAG TPA: XRE family transcriptional regulator, partial [Erysipelotrichaceae bacterium]|nr:XRE family transcriptional regulator [Erysipelotrichaceae bacterium]